MSGTSTIHAEQGVTPGHHGSNSNVTPGEIAIGVVIGRASEYFDFLCTQLLRCWCFRRCFSRLKIRSPAPSTLS